MIIILLLIINAFIGSLTYYLLFKELPLGIMLVSAVCGLVMPLCYIMHLIITIFEHLNEIKIIRSKDEKYR